MYITFRDTKPFEDQPLSLPVSTIVSLIFPFFFFFHSSKNGQSRRSSEEWRTDLAASWAGGENDRYRRGSFGGIGMGDAGGSKAAANWPA